MNRKLALIVVLLAGFFAFTSSVSFAQDNTNSTGGQMKSGTKEVGKAGKSMGQNVKHGRVVKGSKHFGKHIGKAGKHFGKGTKRAVKKVVS
jgi:type IV secretory pathway VirB6-like protein